MAGSNNKNPTGKDLNFGYDDYLETEMVIGKADEIKGLKTDRSKQTEFNSIHPSDFLETDMRKGTEGEAFFLQTDTEKQHAQLPKPEFLETVMGNPEEENLSNDGAAFKAILESEAQSVMQKGSIDSDPFMRNASVIDPKNPVV